MQNNIIISRTYSEITPESAEHGEFSDHGFVSEKEEVSFTELIYLMRIHNQASQSPNDGNINVSYSTGYSIDDYRTGTQREETIHYHKDNAQNVAKYWKYAAKMLGRI